LLLNRLDSPLVPEDEVGDEGAPDNVAPPDPEEIVLLREVERNLEAVVAGSDIDPNAGRPALPSRQAVAGDQRRDHIQPIPDDGAVVLEALCDSFPNEPVALYAGGAASFVQRGQSRTKASRELIKRYIQDGDIRLVCATDAACEGLKLQRLGAQVNIDMPWNPSRLEQRKGRIQRIGEVRDNVPGP
jgi:hypothetical protein